MKKIIFLFLIFTNYSNIGLAQRAGDLDSSFGTNGIVRRDFGASSNIYGAFADQLLTDTSGAFYLIFHTNEQAVIAHFFADGSLDTLFGIHGYLHIITGRAILQPGGKIIVAGGNYIARYNAIGKPDYTFNKTGIVTSVVAGISDVAVQNDGKIVVVAYNALARYNANGSRDQTFNSNILTGEGPSIAIQGDNRIIVFGTFKPLDKSNNKQDITKDGDYRSFAILTRLNANGSIDSSFGTDGKSAPVGDYSIANMVVIQKDGKILVVDSNISTLARYDTDGSPDSTFSGDGLKYLFDLYIESGDRPLAIQKDGKIVIAGTVSGNPIGEDFALVRLHADGSADSTFSGDGEQTTDFGLYDFISCVGLQNDGKVMVSGYTTGNGAGPDFAIARYEANGNPDTTFSNDGKFSDYWRLGDTKYNSLAIQKDGKIVTAGVANKGYGNDFAIARYNADGSFDTTFSKDGKQTTNFENDDEANSIVLQDDGKIVVAGISNETYSFPSETKFAIARYNIDGSLDTTFSKDGKLTTNFGFQNIGHSALAERNGKIVVAMSGLHVRYTSLIAQYNSNGTLDTTFSKDGLREGSFVTNYQDVKSVAIQNDGKIVVAGLITDNNVKERFAVARYNTDGTDDKSFSDDGKHSISFGSSYNADATSLAIQTNGKIVMAGYAQQQLLQKNFAFVRLNTDGTVDTSFSGDGRQVIPFDYSDGASSVVIQKDGKIVAAGNSGENFAITRLTSSGILDSSFGKNGKQITVASKGADRINNIIISGDKLYAAGYGQSPGNQGIIARYLLESQVPSTVNFVTNKEAVSNPASIPISGVTSKALQVSNGLSLLKSNNPINAPVNLRPSPNPTNSILNIYTTGFRPDKKQTIIIMSAAGMAVKTLPASLPNKMTTLNIASLPAGVYTINIISDNKVLYKQFLKL